MGFIQEITMVPVGKKIDKEPCFAMIQEDATDRVLWSDGPYPDKNSAVRAAERQALLLLVEDRSVDGE